MPQSAHPIDLPPRTHNVLNNLLGFAREWDRPGSSPDTPIPHAVSRAGNINYSGDAMLPRSALATRHHAQFLDVVEPRVRTLVAVLAYHHDLITYTSCEGHRPNGQDVMPTERHAGVLPRTIAETEAVRSAFSLVAEKVNEAIGNGPVRIGVMDHRVNDGNRAFPALDIYVARATRGTSWSAYFQALERPYGLLVDALKALSPIHAPSMAKGRIDAA